MGKFLVVLALASFGILASCTRPHDASSDSKKVQPPESEREAATLSQQKMCAEQAKKSFEDSAFSKDNTSTYTSHYETRTNFCYVEVASRPSLATNVFSYNLLVYDAFEGRPYGELSVLYPSPEQVVKCRVTPHGAQREITCKSLEEFNGLVLKYFGVTPN